MTERPPSKNAWLRMSPLPRAVGIVCIVVGGVWLLQGIGVAQGSVMTGSTLWAILGALGLVVGALVLQRALRTARQAIADDAPAAEPQAGALPPGDGQSPPSA
jgi:hypothetical protein